MYTTNSLEQHIGNTHNIDEHALFLTRFTPYGKARSDSLALIVPPIYIFIDNKVLNVGDLFVAWNTFGEYQHLDFANRIGMSSYCYPYETLALALIRYSVFSPINAEADECMNLAGEILDKLSVIYDSGEVADETAVALRVLSLQKASMRPMADSYSKALQFKLGKKLNIPYEKFVDTARRTYVTSSIRCRGAHAKAIECGRELLKMHRGSLAKAHAALCRTSMIDLVDKDLLTWDISQMREDFKARREFLDRDFRLERFIGGKTIPEIVPHGSREAMCLIYFPMILKYSAYFREHPRLPKSFRKSMFDTTRYKTPQMLDLFSTIEGSTAFQLLSSSRGLFFFNYPKNSENYTLWIIRNMVRMVVADRISEILWNRNLLASRNVKLALLEILNSRWIPAIMRKSYSSGLSLATTPDNVLLIAPGSSRIARLHRLRELFHL